MNRRNGVVIHSHITIRDTCPSRGYTSSICNPLSYRYKRCLEKYLFRNRNHYNPLLYCYKSCHYQSPSHPQVHCNPPSNYNESYHDSKRFQRRMVVILSQITMRAPLRRPVPADKKCSRKHRGFSPCCQGTQGRIVKIFIK